MARGATGADGGSGSGGTEEARLGEMAAAILAARRSRVRHLPGEWLGEPFWDALLALYAASARGEALGVAELALRTGLPASTASRVARALAYHGALAAGATSLRLNADAMRRVADALKALRAPEV